MARIFLCHASEDKAQVREVYRRLAAIPGFEPWLDEVEILPGQDWDYEIERALEGSDFVMVFLSTRSVEKVGYVQREFRRALFHAEEMPEGYIHTIPVKLDDCVVPRRFSRHQWANLYENGAFDRIVRAFHYGLQQRGQPLPEPYTHRPSSAASVMHATDMAPLLTNSIDMEFVLIPAGTFMMGSPDRETEAASNERPSHRVTISQPFYLGKYPVTQAQWEAVIGNNPSHFTGDPTRPVELVSWDDVQAFLHKLNKQEGSGDYRLPTEAQWEYACCAGKETPRYYPDINAIAWYEENSSGHTHPVGQKLPNAWGLYDMLGNVYEWCHDGPLEYANAGVVDPVGPTEAGADRVVRGGGWLVSARYVRSAYRKRLHPGRRSDDLGFRVMGTNAICRQLD